VEKPTSSSDEVTPVNRAATANHNMCATYTMTKHTHSKDDKQQNPNAANSMLPFSSQGPKSEGTKTQFGALPVVRGVYGTDVPARYNLLSVFYSHLMCR